MKLFLIRHLPTAWNLAGKLQGTQNIGILPPDEAARRSIDKNLSVMIEQNRPFQEPLVLASTLKRTQQTAAVYGFHEYRIEPLLDELNFGCFEGRSRDELVAVCAAQWFDAPEALVLGEPLTALVDRIQACLEYYKPHKFVIIFGHGCWIRAALSLLKYGDLRLMNKITLKNNDMLQLTL